MARNVRVTYSVNVPLALSDKIEDKIDSGDFRNASEFLRHTINHYFEEGKKKGA